MKKLFFVILSAGLMLSACKKDKEMPTNNGFNPHDDKAVEARIKSFNQSLQQKQGEPMTVSDATWNIEAALNYNYCRTDLQQGLTSQDSIFFEMPVSDGTVSFSNVSEAYNQAVAKIQTLLKGENLHLVVIDVKPLQTEGIFKAKIFFMASKDITNESKDVLFTNAASQISYYIATHMPAGYYYTDVEHFPVLPYWYQAGINPNWNGQYINYYYYRMFNNYTYFPAFHQYLNQDELNFYTQGTITLLNTYTTQGGPRPVGKMLSSCNIEGRTWNNNGQLQQIYHCASPAYYGIAHLNPPNN